MISSKTGILIAKKNAKIVDRKIRKIRDNEVLIKVEKCNLCTTDYQQWQGLREHQGYPMAGGHENTGLIIEKGNDVLELQIGDRISIAYDYCSQCDNCRKGRTYECKNIDFDNKSEDGFYGYFGLSEYQIVDAKKAIKIDKDIPAEEACFLEPLGTVVHGIKKLNINPSTNVAVVGGGTMGLLNALTARAYGARVIITEISKKKIKNAKDLGFEVVDSGEEKAVEKIKELTNGEGVDAVIGAVGLSSAYEEGLKMLKEQRGKFLVFSAGYPVPTLNLDMNDVHYREVEIVGTMGGNISDFVEAGELLSSGKINVSGCLEHKEFPLSRIQDAYAEAAKDDMFRVTVNCQE